MRIGVIHRYAESPFLNKTHMLGVCWGIALQGDFPVCPALYMTQFLDDEEPAQRELGLKLSGEWLRTCDKVRVYGQLSDGMQSDLEAVQSAGIPIEWLDDNGHPRQGVKL